MIVRPRLVLVILLLFIALLTGVALLIPHGGERMVARATTKVSGDALRDCLGTGLGLGAWQGVPQAMHAAKLGLRVAVTDNGHDRLVGLFTAGGQPLSSSESAALQACLAQN